MKPKVRIPNDVLCDIADCPAGRRAGEVRKTAAQYGTSAATVYRSLQKFEDRISELQITDEERRIVMAGMALKMGSRGRKHQRISTRMAIDEAVLRGMIPRQDYDRARIDTVARALGLDEKHMRTARPCVRLATPGPNTWGQIDFTVAQCFYLKNMRVYFRDPLSKKEPEKKVILGGYVDMNSRCKFWHAYEALGENTRDATDFLFRSFSKKDTTFPMHGLPFHLYADQGSPFKSRFFRILLERLGIELRLHMPGNARATGMIERSFQEVQRFEALLKTRVHPHDWPSIDDFNRWLYEFAIDHNNRKTEASAKTRFETWLEIHPEDLRECPPRDVFMNLTTVGKVTARVTKDLCIHYGAREYNVGISDLCGEKVTVFVNVDGRVWVQHPFVGFHGPLEEGVKTNMMGVDFERPPLTFWEKNQREALEIFKAQGMTGPGKYYSRNTEKIHKVPAPIQNAEPETPERMSTLEAKLLISKRIGMPLAELPPSTRDLIHEVLDSNLEDDGAVPAEVVDEICDRIKEVLCSE